MPSIQKLLCYGTLISNNISKTLILQVHMKIMQNRELASETKKCLFKIHMLTI
jgi:hypothetical protein